MVNIAAFAWKPYKPKSSIDCDHCHTNKATFQRILRLEDGPKLRKVYKICNRCKTDPKREIDGRCKYIPCLNFPYRNGFCVDHELQKSERLIIPGGFND